ncbi:MAG: dihydroorotate dehydrogenase [Chloroflexia bacterium]|nr:dihydroorotate dehydrogenase [Chloroflexia bacterium]
MPNLQVDLAPHCPRELRLRNPVLVASGCFGYGLEYARWIDIQRLGAIVSKGTTLEPRLGNPPPRLVETPAGLLNSIGLQNPGLGRVVEEYAPLWAQWQVPVLLNISGETVSEYAELARRLEEVPGVAGLEVNISCPNVEAGGMAFGVDPQQAAAVTRAVCTATTLPVLVKLTPNVTDIVAVAQAVVEAGADALTLINTVCGMVMDVAARRPVLPRGIGGLSGPAIRPIALALVYQVAGAVDVPIVAVGGICTAHDAMEFFLAGAAAVQVGSACFADPQAPLRILDDLAAWMSRQGLGSLEQLVGAGRQKGV